MNLTQAACIGWDPELWFATEYRSADRTTALLICNGDERNPVCPIRQACLEQAMVTEAKVGGWNRSGVFGGLTALQRKRLAEGLTPDGLQPHGTPAARKRHWRAGEPNCALCQPTRIYRKRAAA